MSVYDAFVLREAKALSEQSALEEFAQFRGQYSLAKRKAEDEAVSHVYDQHPSWTILRPALILGTGKNVFDAVGTKIGNLLLVPGPPKRTLGLVHVDDVVAAIVKVLQNENTRGRIFNVSGEAITQREYIDEFIRQIGYDKLRVIYVPYWLARAAAGVLFTLSRLTGGRIPNIHERRLASVYQNARIDSAAIREQTGWVPSESLLSSLIREQQKSKLIPTDARGGGIVDLTMSIQ